MPAVSADSGKVLGWRVGRLSAAGASVADAAWRRKRRWQGEWLPAQTALKSAGLEKSSRWRLVLWGWRCLTAPVRQRPSRCAVCLRHRELFARRRLRRALTTEAVLGSRRP